MKNLRVEATLVALGLVLMGFFVRSGLVSFAERDRSVVVRGLAEREVQADRVIWPIVYKTVGNDLAALYAQINRVNAEITDFLKQNGITDKEITVSAPQVLDILTDRYQANNGPRDRYNVTTVLTVSSGQVDVVRGLMARMGELLKKGIAISENDYQNRVQFEFTSLNKIKPEMIEEATRNGREAAQKFAKDSDSRLGKIKTASQGLFSIDDRDSNTPHIKRIRVVTNITYYLDN